MINKVFDPLKWITHAQQYWPGLVPDPLPTEEEVRTSLSQLSPRYHQVMMDRFSPPYLTLDKVGERCPSEHGGYMGCSRERIRQMLARSTRTMLEYILWLRDEHPMPSKVPASNPLLPCPFCGAIPKEPININTGTSRRPEWKLHCPRFCVSMARSTRKELISDWNTRYIVRTH